MSWKSAFARCGMEMAYWSGAARLLQNKTGGLGIILGFERVRPRNGGDVRLRKRHEITPRFLDRVLRAVRRWNYDIIPIDEVLTRLRQPSPGRRFVCLTFDGGYRDILASAGPVLARHAVPYTVYLPSSFPDGFGEAWWLALEQAVVQNDRLGLVIDGVERRFTCSDPGAKQELFDYLESWLRSLDPAERSHAIKDICGRYQIDLRAISDAAVMSWDDIRRLAADPLVTFGSATVNYPVLATMRAGDAEREMKMGRAVLETALNRPVAHFAYPFGDQMSVSRRDIDVAAATGFASALTTTPGVITKRDLANLAALPRLSWDGRRHAVRLLLTMMSGVATRW